MMHKCPHVFDRQVNEHCTVHLCRRRIGEGHLPCAYWVGQTSFGELSCVTDHDYCYTYQQVGREAAEAKLTRLTKLAAMQAEDEGLWFIAKTAPEGYLQQELRALHSAIEEMGEA